MGNIQEYLKLDKEELLNLMGQHLDLTILNMLDESAIQNIAQNHRMGYDEMYKILKASDKHYLIGGEYAKEYYRLIRLHTENLIRNTLSKIDKNFCIKIKYCEKRANGDFENENVSFLIALADTLVSYKINLPFPAGTTAVYLVKNGILDNLCKCD